MGRFWTRKSIIALLLVSLIGSSITAGGQASQLTDLTESNLNRQQTEGYKVPLPEGFQIVSSTPTSLVLDIQAPSYSFGIALTEAQTCNILKANGYFQFSSPGEPGLVSAGVMLGVSLDITPTFTIQSIETVDIPGQVHLCPVATPIIQHDPIGLAVDHGDVLTENVTAYSQDVYLPTQPVELVISGMIRSQRVARLNFAPFLYNPAMEKLRLISHIKLEIKLAKDGYINTASIPVDEGPFESLLQKTMINYDQARLWRSPYQPDTPLQISSSLTTPLAQSAYKIQVDQDGIYQVTYAALQAAGVPVSYLDTLNPHTLRILDQGVEIPIYVFGEDDGTFNSGDYLLFYGQKTTTKYTNSNIYWLSWSGADGLRMSTRDGTVHSASSPVSFNTTMHLEQDHEYFTDTPSSPQMDHWFWFFLDASSSSISHDFTFLLQNLDASPHTARVRGLLKGYYANPQHHTLIYINGHLIDDHTWPSTSEYSFSIDIPQVDLVEGTNTLTVACPLDSGITVDQVLINWFDIDFYHTYTSENNSLVFSGDQPGLWKLQIGGFSSDVIDIFDITNPLIPARIVNGSVVFTEPNYQVNFEQQVTGVNDYLALTPSRWLIPVAITQDVPSNLKDNSNGADYIIISHADFLSAIQPLATYRASQGLRVKVVDVQDVYDDFNGGVFDPHAIQTFLAYTYAHWIAPAPAYVLLVGDGHYDFKDNYGSSGTNYIPPYLGDFDPWIGETAADNRYVTVSGSDILPDMFIGRLPVNSVSETTDMVNKILAYDQNPSQGDWNTRLTFVADNADSGGNFPDLSNNIADHYVPSGYQAEKIYYSIPPYTVVADTRVAILNAINQGRLIVTYTGHASTQLWAGETLFSVNNIANLANAGMYPFFAPMTCLEGYFIFPKSPGWNYPSLAESLVRASNKGAIASFSPAGFGLANGHDILAQGLYRAFFAEGTTQFGAATTFAKYFLDANSSSFRDLIDTYNLFGDPATNLKIAPTAVLVFFNGKALPGTIQLNWETINESWLVGFNLYRSESLTGTKQKLNLNLIPAQKPGQMQGALYEYDDAVDNGKIYFYWIELVQVYGRYMLGPISETLLNQINLPVVIR
jgi:hypothetical protein